MLARGRLVVGRIRAAVLLLRRVISMHPVVPVLGDDGRARPVTLRAQHGRCHCAPDGKQDGKQDQNKDAKSFHVEHSAPCHHGKVKRCPFDRMRSAYFAVGITNSAPLAMLAGQRCMIDFCLV